MKKLLIVLCSIALVGGIAILIVGFRLSREVADNEYNLESALDSIKMQMTPETEPETTTDSEPPVSVEVTDEPETTTDAVTEPETTEPETTEPETTKPETTVPETTAVDQPLDFTAAMEINPDIYAWIEIPGTVIDYPVLQSATDDTKYLTTAYDGSYYIGGSLFTEHQYNSRDFNDRVTIIYGHTMRSGALFGSLQEIYSDSTSFAECSKIKIYLNNEVRTYQVFAAVPYDTSHILYTYDFTNDYWYDNFFKSIRKIRALEANFDDSYFPETGDQVIILSTCMTGNANMRYLVMAVRV